MTRPLRINIKDGLYHVTSRGNERKNIYADKRDREEFLEILAMVVERFEWICHAYCMMDNHYHLVIETPLGNLSEGMRQLNGVYTQYFNIRNKRVGHLFQGRFKAVIVEKDAHLLELVRYVELNPVKAKICKTAGDYEWSSYRAITGITKKPGFLFTDWILSQFGRDRKAAIKMYQEFVNEGGDENIWNKLTGQIYLGSKDFIEKLGSVSSNLEEIPRKQRQPIRPELKELLRKEKGILSAYIEHKYTMKEIAGHLGVHYATVGRKIRKLELAKQG